MGSEWYLMGSEWYLTGSEWFLRGKLMIPHGKVMVPHRKVKRLPCGKVNSEHFSGSMILESEQFIS